MLIGLQLLQYSHCERIQALAGQVDLFARQVDLILVVLHPKWLKFGLQAYFHNIFGHAKFQLLISYAFGISYEINNCIYLTTQFHTI